MAQFYNWPYWILAILQMLIAFFIIAQTLVVTQSISRLRNDWKIKLENGMEIGILIVLFCYAAMISQVLYGLSLNCLLPSGFELYREIIFYLIIFLCVTGAVSLDVTWPFFVIVFASMLYPLAEYIFGAYYPYFFLSAILFFGIRSIRIYFLYTKELRNSISLVSVKEAINQLHSGLLLCRMDGEIVLCNQQMNELGEQLIGKNIKNGKEFEQTIKSGTLAQGCFREKLADQMVFRLADGHIWGFKKFELILEYRNHTLMIADDVTEYWNTVSTLVKRNEELEKRRQELSRNIENLQAICEAEEIARGKDRVHDLLGHRISLLLRALRGGRQPDEKLFLNFVEKLPSALREDNKPNPARRLELLVDTFGKMGVQIQIQGRLPKREEIAETFSKIAIECVTNATRHGYANHIQIHFFENEAWHMNVTNNGLPPEKPIHEGGGISGMRHRVQQLCGKIEIQTEPQFRIQISIPKEQQFI